MVELRERNELKNKVAKKEFYHEKVNSIFKWSWSTISKQDGVDHGALKSIGGLQENNRGGKG